MRQIVLDTETTGLEWKDGHRIIEIGCYELSYRRPTGRTFHHYLNPDREIDEGALEVHGIDNGFLADKPRFPEVVDAFLEFVTGAELIIHNAPFDVGFIDHELRLMEPEATGLAERARITDSLAMAREMHPGQRNGLDALCKRYGIDNSQRELHGALLDAQILADVYLAMTGGQTALSLDSRSTEAGVDSDAIRRLPADRPALTVIRASEAEAAAHDAWLAELDAAVDGGSLWRRLDTGPTS